MIDYLAFNARYHPERQATGDLNAPGRWTYREFDELVARYATALDKHGMRQGERLACLAKNCVSLVALHLACARLGAIYVPLNWRWSPVEIGRVLDETEPELVLGDSLLGAQQINGVDIDEFDSEADACEIHPTREIDPDLPSLILFTSGTSGRPKGAVLTERNLAETAFNASLLLRVTQDSVFLCDAPMFHVIGLVANIRPVLMQGGSFLVSDGFEPARTLQRLADPELHITHYFCVPQMAGALRAEPAFDPVGLQGLTALFTGGAPHPADSITKWLDDGILAVDGFGMSEAGTVFGMPVDAGVIRSRTGSCGLAAPRLATRIVSDSGEVLGPGDAGELQLRGKNIFSEYWRRPEDSRSAFTIDGWFHTGDIARCDAEGFHWIVDRKKDMFISGGENVYPAEIEAALLELDDIAECAVVGVADERWGESGHLYLVTRPGCELNDKEVLAHLQSRIARYKIPKQVSFIDALPRNAAGKILKDLLRTRHKESSDELE